MPGPSAKPLQRFAAIIAGTALGLVALEIMLRLFSAPPQIVDLEPRSSAQALAMQETPDQLYLLTDRGLRLRPNTIATIHNHRLSKQDVSLRTNSLGYRNRELAVKSGPRLLFLGDSITFADYVDEKDSFVRIIEDLSKKSSRPFETVNAAVGGTGLPDYLNMLTETGMSVEPDMVVVGLYLNDFQRSRTTMPMTPPHVLRRSWLAHRLFQSLSRVKAAFEDPPPDSVSKEELAAWHREIQNGFAALEPAAQEGDPFKDLVLEYTYDWGGAWSRGGWDRMTGVLKQMKDKIDRAGLQMAIVVFPVRHQVDEKKLYDFPQRKARDVARELEVPLIDVLPALRRERERSAEPLFYDHCHYTPYGDQVVAKEIYERLAFLIPASG